MREESPLMLRKNTTVTADGVCLPFETPAPKSSLLAHIASGAGPQGERNLVLLPKSTSDIAHLHLAQGYRSRQPSRGSLDAIALGEPVGALAADTGPWDPTSGLGVGGL